MCTKQAVSNGITFWRQPCCYLLLDNIVKDASGTLGSENDLSIISLMNFVVLACEEICKYLMMKFK